MQCHVSILQQILSNTIHLLTFKRVNTFNKRMIFFNFYIIYKMQSQYHRTFVYWCTHHCVNSDFFCFPHCLQHEQTDMHVSKVLGYMLYFLLNSSLHYKFNFIGCKVLHKPSVLLHNTCECLLFLKDKINKSFPFERESYTGISYFFKNQIMLRFFF